MGKLSAGLAARRLFASVCELDVCGAGSDSVSDFHLSIGGLCAGAAKVSGQARVIADYFDNAGDSVSNFGDSDFSGFEMGTSDQYLRRVDFANGGKWIWNFSTQTVLSDDSDRT